MVLFDKESYGVATSNTFGIFKTIVAVQTAKTVITTAGIPNMMGNSKFSDIALG